jgi:hypothetical protein
VISFKTVIQKFEKQGEKTGWSFIEVPTGIAQKLKPGNKKSFRVKGTLDKYKIKQKSLLPVGDGNFILPINAAMRKATGKREGSVLVVKLEEDRSKFVLNPGLMACLEDEPGALKFFNTLPGSHRRYFSKWIESAKTEATKTKRIAQAVNALAAGLGFAEMLRAGKEK